MKIFRYLTKKLRKTPDFLVLGANKCGTTTLYNYLIRHPQIAKPMTKEIHFFSYKYFKGLDWYRLHFPLKITKRKIFEASTTYFPSECVPKRVYNLNGAIIFIVLLREPLDKAISFWNEVHPHIDTFPFLESPFLDFYLQRSEYHLHIKNWFEFFDPTNFLFLQSEDFFTRPNQVFNRICKFLCINPYLIEERKDNVRGSRVTNEIKTKLGHYFDETKKKVEELVGIKWTN